MVIALGTFRGRLCAIDTSSTIATVALWENGIVVLEREREASHSYGETLLPLIDEVVREAGWSPRSIERWGVGLGPGSFTGVRIALATVKGIALSTGSSVVGVSGFDSLALTADGDPSAQVIEAYRNEVFLRILEDGVSDSPRIVSYGDARTLLDALAEAHEDFVCVGEACSRLGLTRARTLWKKPSDVPRAGQIAHLASIHPPANLDLIEPLYIRPPDITVPKGT